MQAAQEVNFYMRTPIDAVSFSAVTMNDMLDRGAQSEEVGKYLINETAIYASIINENNTGIYAYYKGDYLDGSGWTPPDDYEPKKRPWYTEAKKADGNIVLVQPYLNLQTFTMMMSVSQLLKDKESVVSMDIFLDSVQERIMSLKKDNPAVISAVVIDKYGFVVAHSDEKYIGSELYKYGTNEMLIVGNKALNQNEKSIETKINGKNCTVFVENINEDWKSILILDNSKMYRSLLQIYMFTSIVILLATGAMLIALINVSRKYKEADVLSKEMQAIAKIYHSVVKIDLKKDTMQIKRKNSDIIRLLEGDMTNFKARSAQIGEMMAIEQSKEMVKNFTDASTFEERFKNTNSMALEFMDSKAHWIRLRFIVVDRDDDGKLHHLFMVIESIDEDRRQQERLRKLSETDMMTGIRNRGSGESLIKKAMAEGTKGMFCLLDADKFKSINDTYGHSVGDKVIIAIASCLQKTFRDSDIVFRLGGDEFAVFSDGVVTEEIGNRIMDRLFKSINSIDIPELEGKKIEISVGASFYPATKEDTFEALYKRADSGTYESKKKCGNIVTFKES